jgi:hypothetical protein
VRFFCLWILFAATSTLAANAARGIQSVNLPDARFTDGRVVSDGAPWNVSEAVIVTGPIDFDLQREVPISGFAIQADNNDDYAFAVSTDGQAYQQVYLARPNTAPGLRTRESPLLNVNARFVRVTPSSGDGNFSISEIEIFEGDNSGSILLVAPWAPKHPIDAQWMWAILGAIVFLFVSSTKLPKVVFAVGAGLVLFSLYNATYLTFTSSEFDAARLAWLKAALSVLAIAALIREVTFKDSWPAHTGATLTALTFSAALGLLCFPNLLKEQFFDAKAQKPTYLHHYDMRTYFPIAKYTDELRFDGVYAASALVVAEDTGGLERMKSVPFRDLRNHDDSNVEKQMEHIAAVRARFTDERWAMFKKDMQYFRESMGDAGFLSSMSDHGGNATPVWLLGAYLTFCHFEASNTSLWIGLWVDILLVLFAFASLWWAYGYRTAAVGMAVFGLMDFYLFGSTWFGAGLRHDWLSLWCIGVCFLKKEKYQLAGATLAWSALIRAFPALAFVALGIPFVHRFLEAKKSNQNLKEALRPFVQIATGATVATVALLLLSVLFFGVQIWPEWLHKVALLDGAGHVNNIAVRTWMLTEKMESRLLALGFLGGLFYVLKNSNLASAAAWGVGLLPFVFNPANYYLHAMFILVVLANEVRANQVYVKTLVWCALLGMCVASYFTTLTSDLASHFRSETWVAVGALVLLAGLTFMVDRPPEKQQQSEA